MGAWDYLAVDRNIIRDLLSEVVWCQSNVDQIHNFQCSDSLQLHLIINSTILGSSTNDSIWCSGADQSVNWRCTHIMTAFTGFPAAQLSFAGCEVSPPSLPLETSWRYLLLFLTHPITRAAFNCNELQRKVFWWRFMKWEVYMQFQNCWINWLLSHVKRWQ